VQQVDASDVRHIVLTHLGFDHAGGLDDFPAATVHLLRQESDHAAPQASWRKAGQFSDGGATKRGAA